MNQSFISLYLLGAGTGVTILLLWFIGVLRHSLSKKFVPDNVEVENLSIKRLIFDWGAKALRYLVWLLYFVFILNLIPQSSSNTSITNPEGKFAESIQKLLNTIVENAPKYALIVMVTIFLMRIAAASIDFAFRMLERRAAAQNHEHSGKRVRTISNTISGTVQVIIVFIGFMLILARAGQDISPILASAGVVGLAIGLGAQNLIKDIFGGLMILFEDQYNVGDIVKIGDVSGSVEYITLRATRIRGADGSYSIIPNGSINVVTNLSKDWSRAVLDVEIDIDEDIEKAMSIMLDTAQKARTDLKGTIIEDPAMLGVDSMTQNGMILRITAKTMPGKQVDIARELRRRIKLAFSKAGIKSPHQRQYVGDTTPQRNSDK